MESSLRKYINQLESVDINLNWYHEIHEYQQGIDSQFSSIVERLDWFLRKNSCELLANRIKKSLSNIRSIVGQFDFVIEILTEELIDKSKENSAISGVKRIELIDRISSSLQDQMATTQINSFLTGFGVVTEDVSIVQSKRVYVQQLLKDIDAKVVLQIGADLGLQLPNKGLLSINNVVELIQDNDLNSVLEDFNRSLACLDGDPEQAIASSSSTLESICKAIIEMEGLTLPKKQTMSVLLTNTVDIVGLDPKQQGEGEVKRILGGIQNVILGISALRTGFSTAHGHGIKKYKLSERHVRLLVNSMITFGTFVLETYIEKTNKK